MLRLVVAKRGKRQLPSISSQHILSSRRTITSKGGDGLPAKQGLYDPTLERDACGVGLVVDIQGRQTHSILKSALQALNNLDHRGAINSDGLTGDGVGVSTQIPRRFFAREMEMRNMKAPHDICDLGVGMIFLPPRGAKSQKLDGARKLVESELERAGVDVIGWRDLPMGLQFLGKEALDACPTVSQVLLKPPTHLSKDADGSAFERLLYVARKRIEKKAHQSEMNDLYIASMSHRTLVYKGLTTAPHLGNLYPDLVDSDYQTAIALFHQRYSTNTFPNWFNAQPFRYLAHNGEINTVQGNINWMTMREEKLKSELFGDSMKDLLPIIDKGGSDSAALDNVFELLVSAGRDPMRVMSMMVPEACENVPSFDSKLKAFYTYNRTLMEPWDGPAALVFSDGRYAGASLDRNGLRPLRYWITESEKLIVGSEAGIVDTASESVLEKGRLGPGMMIAVDTQDKRLMRNEDIKYTLARKQPYKKWLDRHINEVGEGQSKSVAQFFTYETMMRIMAPNIHETLSPEAAETANKIREDNVRLQKVFGYGKEEVDRLLTPMLKEGKYGIGSMGDDTPLACLSTKPQMLYRYFKQRFAEVTNPPIDPLLEEQVMSISITFGRRGQLLKDDQKAASLVKFASPIITETQLDYIKNLSDKDEEFRYKTIDTTFPVEESEGGLEQAVKRICMTAEMAVDNGEGMLILSDRNVGSERAPIPMLLACSAIHHSLIQKRKRMRASIIVDSGEPREDHHMACLLAYGASLIHPYLAFETVVHTVGQLRKTDPTLDLSVEQGLANYRSALELGILRILSKMGISTVDSYRGAQPFESIGLDDQLVEKYFSGTINRISAVNMTAIGRDVLQFHDEAFSEDAAGLKERGSFKVTRAGEYHAFNNVVFNNLRKSARSGKFEDYLKYAKVIDNRQPMSIRDLLQYKTASTPIPLDEVESAADIARRFCTQAMSHGSISKEAHEVFAVAMNRLGAKSNSGEGGENPNRFLPYEEDVNVGYLGKWSPRKGDWGNSAIKQVASGRFGLTPPYLISAKEIEIKMAQGSKPGEGGQIPGHKVSEEIAANRRAIVGTTLISPPPHHDIYSIEDLAQLIFDLKSVNKQARVGVKLVSEAGVGTIAAGVVKGYADNIQISGYDGGTGASPLSSVKNAGLPWELGLAEVQQVLVMNNLRGRVTLRVDGGLKTGRDVVMGALFGAESFGFGSAALVAAGCVMARKCHLNTCPVGIATSREDLRAKFKGEPEHVVTFMLSTAEQVRRILAEMGVRKLDDIIGRTDLLQVNEEAMAKLPKCPGINLDSLLHNPDPKDCVPRKAIQERNDRPGEANNLDDMLWSWCEESVKSNKPIKLHFAISNRERSIGARLSGEIARHCGSEGMAPGSIELTFNGIAGQSFGAFCNEGMRLVLRGEAQDYVGKSMYGGEIVVTPPADSYLKTGDNVIIGNTVMYGATGGVLYAAGVAGERFAVRNAGGTAVVEGVGDHGCEYMTNGKVVVLGKTGRNFGAGMTGGEAYVMDCTDSFLDRYNKGSVKVTRLEGNDKSELLELLDDYHGATGSETAQKCLNDWDIISATFWKVSPIESAAATPVVKESEVEDGELTA